MPEYTDYRNDGGGLHDGRITHLRTHIMKKTVLITGCSSGIGKASAKLFAGQGWNVVATMRDPQQGKELAEIDGILVTRLDVQDPASIDAAIDAGIERFGKIDLLINNAGYGQFGLFEAISREKIQAQFDVNVFGVMDVTRAILPHFRQNRSGLIINVSSGAGIFTLPMISLYSASKFALEGFSEALAYELSSQNIGVKLVLPHGGVTETKFSERQAGDIASDPALADYDDFVGKTMDLFAGMMAARPMSSSDVAETIFNAAADDTDTLRYYVGDPENPILKARYDLSEQDYVRFMRARFMPKS
jgi:NAD(P)-dependent dehydrogenase (short-subunit alcohol dehydrogenase family)